MGYAATGRLIYTVRVDGPGRRARPATTTSSSWTGRDLPDAVEVGHTWYVPEVRGTDGEPRVQVAAAHAMPSTPGVRRASRMRTDARNAASRAAMLKLGMTFEGVRRRHMLGADGTLRDSAYFSAVADEWPAIKAGLEQRLS